MLIIIGSVCGCGLNQKQHIVRSEKSGYSSEPYSIRTAVLYCGGDTWRDLYDYLDEALMMNLSVDGVYAEEMSDLSGYDIVYLDKSLMESDRWEETASCIQEYTEKGGAVFMSNEFCDRFSSEFSGVKETVSYKGFPEKLSAPDVDPDLAELQEIVTDFYEIYKEYNDFKALSKFTYGPAVDTETAVPLVEYDGNALYALNSYGKGFVFMADRFLPNTYSSGSFSMSNEGKGVDGFACTTASFNQLLLNSYAGYISKQKYGYALSRAFGYFGTPSESWEVHYGENLESVKQDVLQTFSKICKEYQQIPSFSLVRSTYDWFVRAESITYLLNQSETGREFKMDFDENAYSSGTHVDCDGKWLGYNKIEGNGTYLQSYFEDYPEDYKNRAYQTALDYDGDGDIDIFAGSEDGTVAWYEGQGFENGHLKVKERVSLTDINGNIVTVDEYSSPHLTDINGDGFLDLAVGCGDGCLYWFKGNGTLTFGTKQLLFTADYDGQSLPEFADLNQDGITDLILGSNKGILIVFYGQLDARGHLRYSHTDSVNLSKSMADAGLGFWIAPVTADWNGDGITDILAGVYDGYIAILEGTGDDWSFAGYILSSEMNYKGNNNVKFGNFAVPQLVDLNGDGKEDLMCGCQEYGMAYPVNSPYYPYYDHLQKQMEYAKKNDYYVGLHLYTNQHASTERELFELNTGLQVMENLGLPVHGIGANLHTWYTSDQTDTQTLENIYRSGLLWQSGFASPKASHHYVQVDAENTVALPFYMKINGEETLLVQNASVLSYLPYEWCRYSAKYGMPVCLYYHCEYVYKSENDAREKAQTASDFQWDYGYNFNSEDQQMYASAAVYHEGVNTSGGLSDGLKLSAICESTDYPLYDENVQKSLGVRICFASDFETDKVQTDADVWYCDGNDMVIGLNREVCLEYGGKQEKSSHISRINMAAEVTSHEDAATVTFLDGGMMQVVVEGNAGTKDKGWKVTERDGQTVFTKYGSREVLTIHFEGESL